MHKVHHTSLYSHFSTAKVLLYGRTCAVFKLYDTIIRVGVSLSLIQLKTVYSKRETTIICKVMVALQWEPLNLEKGSD